jgi:membrane-associated phospholipid phosphatase
MATEVLQAPSQILRWSGAWKQAASRFNCIMAWIVAILIPAEIVLAITLHLSGLVQLLAIWPALLVLIVILCYCRWYSFPKLVDLSELAIWSVLLTDILSLLIQLAGRSNRQLQDHALQAFDSHIHFNTAFFVHLVDRVPALHIATSIVYASLPLLILAAVLIPPLCGHADASRRYILGIVLSAVITALVFALWPAAGPWTTESFQPTREQAMVTDYLTLLNSRVPVVLDMQKAGIVSFPSYHVVLAILSALALSSVRRLRAPAWILAVLVCVSTVLTGWHYGIDVLGGLLVAMMTAPAVRRITTSEFIRATDR